MSEPEMPRLEFPIPRLGNVPTYMTRFLHGSDSLQECMTCSALVHPSAISKHTQYHQSIGGGYVYNTDLYHALSAMLDQIEVVISVAESLQQRRIEDLITFGQSLVDDLDVVRLKAKEHVS